MREIIVPEKFNNKKITDLLYSTFNGLKSNTLFKALRQKDIRINNVRIRSNETVHTGDIIKVFIIDELLFSNKKLEIVYEDTNIIVVNKPINIEVEGEKSLTEKVNEYCLGALPCHRLDRNTSGLIIYTKDNKSREILFEKIKNHEIKKYYKCKVFGKLPKNHDIIKAYLFKDSNKSLVYISDEPQKGYREIITEYNVISYNKKENSSELEILLHTGRTHQIRAHLAHIGFPIIGDGKYGINEINKKFNAKTQILSAYKLIFDFKTDSEKLEYLNKKVIEIEQI